MPVYDRRTALVVVDVQNDFADPKGTLHVAGAEEALPEINREIERARGSGAHVLYTRDWHPPETPHFEKDGGVWPVHCVRDTWGAELHPALHRGDPADEVRKGTGGEDGYSGFTVRDPRSGEEGDTQLERMLRERGVERVVIVGLALDYCVKDTALDAARRGFEVVVPLRATRAVEREAGDGARAVEALERAGVAVEDREP